MRSARSKAKSRKPTPPCALSQGTGSAEGSSEEAAFNKRPPNSAAAPTDRSWVEGTNPPNEAPGGEEPRGKVATPSSNASTHTLAEEAKALLWLLLSSFMTDSRGDDR